MTLLDKAFIDFCSTCWAKGYNKPYQDKIEKRFKKKFHLWTWDEITQEQMDKVMNYVNNLPNKK